MAEDSKLQISKGLGVMLGEDAQNSDEAVDKAFKKKIEKETTYYLKIIKSRTALINQKFAKGLVKCPKCGDTGWTWSIGFVAGLPQLLAHWCDCEKDKYYQNKDGG